MLTKDAMEDPICNWSFPYTHCVCLIKGFKTVLLNPFVRSDQAIVVCCSFWYLGKPKIYISILYYVTSFFSKIPRRKEVVEFEEIKIKKKFSNIPSNLKCNVRNVNMLCLLLQDTAAVFIYFFRSGYLRWSLYLCLGHCSGYRQFDSRILNIRKSLHRVSLS
jgi:hypothetical protein